MRCIAILAPYWVVLLSWLPFLRCLLFCPVYLWPLCLLLAVLFSYVLLFGHCLCLLRVLNIRSWKGKGGSGSTGRRQCILDMTRATPVIRGAHSRAGCLWRWSTLDIIHISLSRRAERGMLLHGVISAKKRPDINHTALTQLALQVFRA